MENNYDDALEQMREEQRSEDFMNEMTKEEARNEHMAEQFQYEMAKEEAKAKSLCFTNDEEPALDATGWNDEDALNVECGDEPTIESTDCDEDGLNIECDDNSICLNNEQ